MKNFLFIILGLIINTAIICSVNAQGKSRQVSGRITDELKTPLPGVAIIVKGTQIGVASGTNGEYTINVPSNYNYLQYSFVGMKMHEESIDGRIVIDVKLEADAFQVEEIVSVGYGSLRKSDLTGAVSQVKVGDIGSRPINSIEQLMQGNTTGVQITQSSGAPGAGININIRGVSSVSGSNQPLVVIDGVPYDGGATSKMSTDYWVQSQPNYNPLAGLNPNDIESLEILKDASSTAIFGSRGANGVILITTKSGKKGGDKITYSHRSDISMLPKKIKVLSTDDYLAYVAEAAANSNDTPIFNEEEVQKYSTNSVNWQDLIYRIAYSHDHQLTISGGTNKNTYSFMGGYSRQNGIVIDTRFDRLTGRLNFRREVSKMFDFGTNISAVHTSNNAAQQSSPNGNPAGSVVTGALTFRPILTPYNEDGSLNGGDLNQGNPLLTAKLLDDDMSTSNYNMSLFANLHINTNLWIKTMIGYSDTRNTRDVYFPRGTFPGDQSGGFSYKTNQSNLTYFLENTINFDKLIANKHRINAVFGYTWQKWFYNGVGMKASGFPNDNLSYNNFSIATSIENPVISRQESALASLLGRINYVFSDRYLVTLTGRTDGSSRLAAGHKWAFFPSLAFGWNVHNEKFMKEQKTISQLKIRASYGFSGNQNIDIGATQASLVTNSTVREPIGTTIYPRFILGRFENGNLGWETTKQLNAGFDMALFNNRIRMSFDYYLKNTFDMLLNLTIPSASGYANYATNVGKVENKGFEFMLDATIINKAVTWTLGGNISTNKNKVLDLGGTKAIFGEKYYTDSNIAINQPAHITMVGKPIGSFYGYRTNGIYQNVQEVAAGPIDPLNPKPGDIRFVNITGEDNAITDADRTILGDAFPDFILGLNSNVSWKNLSLFVLVQGRIGSEVLNMNRIPLDGLFSKTYTNISQQAYDNRWRGEGTSNYYPRAASTGSGPLARRVSDILVEDGSYVRLKTLSISYEIPKKFFNNLFDVKMTLSGTNLLTITNYSGYDPEVGGRDGSNLTPGVDLGTIPQYRTYSFGASINF